MKTGSQSRQLLLLLQPRALLQELVFLSITVLRPYVAKDLTTKHGTGGFGGLRACALGVGPVALNLSVHAAPVPHLESLPFLHRGDLASCSSLLLSAQRSSCPGTS